MELTLEARTQSNELLIVPGQNMTFPSKKRLILMSATEKEAYISGLGLTDAFQSLFGTG